MFFARKVAEAAETLPHDVALVAADGSCHHAHRLVLSARSPFFLKMLSSGMREQASGQVRLPDVEPERLEAMLAWMYGREALIDRSSPVSALALLELAERWQVTELCEQLSSCEACALSHDNFLPIWEAAQRMNLGKLESRCFDYAMQQVADVLEDGVFASGTTLPAFFCSLLPQQVKMLLESDNLPVVNEESTLEFALAYVDARGGPLPAADLEELFLAIRWRLVPGPVIAERAMRAPALQEPGGGALRPRLLTAVADGMQFQFLGGKAWSMLPSAPASRLRLKHRIPVAGFAGLAAGMQVKVIADTEELRHLCKRCAPGARLKVEWVAEMRTLAGATCRVKELREEICGAQIEDPDPGKNCDRYLPFDALLLA